MEQKKIQTALVGGSGYAERDPPGLPLTPPRLKGAPPVFAGRVEEGRESVPLASLHPQLADNHGSPDLKLEHFEWDLLKDRGVDLLFLATPHEMSRSWVPEAIARGLRV